jgi:hypothetical protein
MNTHNIEIVTKAGKLIRLVKDKLLGQRAKHGKLLGVPPMNVYKVCTSRSRTIFKIVKDSLSRSSKVPEI